MDQTQTFNFEPNFSEISKMLLSQDAKDQKRFFGVPNIEKESARRQIWIQLLHLDPKKFKTSTKICAKHFDESDILPNRLKQGTNPTRNFPVSIPKPFLKAQE